MEAVMSILFRTIVYASLFIGFLLIYLPDRILAGSGLARPSSIGFAQWIGFVLGSAGAVVALWCVTTFVRMGKGTPAPFDPPRLLVVRGPYRYVRNPMYLGAGLALAGAALFYRSLPVLVYGVVLLFCANLFVLFYEEPTLRRKFGADYEAYCQEVRRWLPGLTATSRS
jgi:protein-S-isoprenylcysteine O-methyltransferase Ste14